MKMVDTHKNGSFIQALVAIYKAEKARLSVELESIVDNIADGKVIDRDELVCMETQAKNNFSLAVRLAFMDYINKEDIIFNVDNAIFQVSSFIADEELVESYRCSSESRAAKRGNHLSLVVSN